MLCETFLIALAFSTTTAAEPPPTADQLRARKAIAEQLTEAANEMFDFPFPVHARVYTVGGCRFKWKVHCDGEVYEYLQSQRIEPMDDRVSQFRNWAVGLNRQCLDLAHSMLVDGGLDPEFNPETDYEFSVDGDVLPAAELSKLPPQAVGFREAAYIRTVFNGSRLVFVYANREAHTLPPADLEPLNGIELTAMIIPDHSQFAFRKPITGTVRLTNTGTRRVPIGVYSVRISLFISDEEGSKPNWPREDGVDVTPPMPEWWERFLMPGESYEERFTLYADIGEAPLIAKVYKLDLGEWTLGFKDKIAQYGVPTVCTPVRIEITGDPESYKGPRASTIISRGDNLIVFREGGWIEAIDPATGSRRGVIHRKRSYLGALLASATIAFSSDGRLAAFGSFGEEPAEWIALYGPQPATTSVSMTGDVRPAHRNGGTYAIGFGPGDRSVAFENSHGVILFDVDTGEEIGRLPFAGESPRASPDGRHIVSVFDPMGRFADGGSMTIGRDGNLEMAGVGPTAEFTIAPFDDPDAVVVRTIEGRGEQPLVTLGRRGAYFVHGLHKGVTYQPYDQEDFVVFGSEYMAVESESADGSLVALRTPGGPATEEFFVPHHQPTTIEVWDVAEQKRLYRIGGDDRHLRACFVGTPARLAVLERATETKPNWYRERIQIYDGRTGEFLDHVDFTPIESFSTRED